MGTMLRNESRRLYSWWWDSHISPKNSKWLQENLTDMDGKVKAMIKLIEEDADSFARRAEMYYKKRPELMKLVEEFYRAYRALAERYDHATVELRHAHRTMAQAFPDQALPFPLGEESQSCSSGPEISLPVHAMVGSNSEVSDSATSKRGLKQLSEIFSSEGCGQNFEEVDSETERALKAEAEVESLKKTLAKVQAEKDSLLLQFQQNVEKLMNAEKDLSLAQRDVGRLDEQATEAETEIRSLKKSLSELEEERDSGLSRVNDFLVKITSLEIRLSQAQDEGKGNQKRAVLAESELNSLRQEISKLEAEKELGLVRYRNCLERISDLESKIALSEEKARLLDDQVRKSEAEIEALKRALMKITEEKEAAELQYKNCLEVISMMELEISRYQANAERLSNEIMLSANKLKCAEDQCLGLESSNQALRSEADSLLDKISEKDRELLEKSRELKKFQSLALEESSKFHQVESTLQALRKLHSQSQEDQRALASELKDGLKMLRDVEICKHGMEEEIQRVKDENKSLSELTVASSLSVKTLQDEIFSLKEMKDRLEHEFARKEDQSEALQKEIGGLNEEINGLKNRYLLILKQVDSAGLSPESLCSAVKDLRDENSKLRELFNRESEEKESLYLKVNDFNKLSSENALLRDSMSGLTLELEDLREKASKLQDSCHSLEGEKSSLVAEKSSLLSQLQIISENMQKLFEKNSSLESSLTGANSDLEQVRMRTQSLDDLCKTLDEEKSDLLNERNSLVAQLEKVEKRLGKLETRFTNLEEKYFDMEKERESAVNQVEELRGCLIAEKRSSEILFAGLRNDVTVLQEETKLGRKEFEEELDRAVNAQIEIFILQKFVEDLEEKNFSLVSESQKHAEAKKFSDKLISELESENLEQQVEAEFLVNEIEKLRLGIHLIFRALQDDLKLEQEQVSVRSILEDIEDLKSSLLVSEDEELKLLVENSVLLTLLAQMRDNGSGLESEKLSLEREFELMKCHYRCLQRDKENLLDMNMDLKSEVNEREIREEKLKLELEDVHVKMLNLQCSYNGLKEQNSKILEENRLLLKKLSSLEREKDTLEEQNDIIVHEVVSLNTLSLVLESFAAEKVMELKELSRDLNAISHANNNLKEETRMSRENLVNKEAEIVSLNETVEILSNNLTEVKHSNDQLSLQASLEKDILKVKLIELSEADEKIKATESLNEKLSSTVEELNIECEELKLHRQILEDKVLELNEESFNQNKKLETLNEANCNLETRVGALCKELEEHKIREESLSSELLEKSNESELWEAEASGFYFDLQISAVREVLLESKVNELVGVCENLEEERSLKSTEMEKIKDKVNLLENHIGKLEAKLSAYVPVVASLRENVASLEHNARLKAKLLEATNQAQKVHRREKSGEELRLSQTSEIPDGILDLQKMQKTIKAVEKAMVEEIEKLAIEAVGEEAEKLAAQETKISNNIVLSDKPENDDKTMKPRNDNNLMKDIQLDQVSDLSLYGRSKRETVGPTDPMLQLWDTRNDDNHNNMAIELTSDIIEPRSRRASSKFSSSQNSLSSLDLRSEKELGVDKLERKRGSGHRGRILERLASDSQKLTSLQRSVADLKKKIETTTTTACSDETNNGNHHLHYTDISEFESVQRHILEVEESVSQLVQVNGSLVKDVEESQLVRDGKSVTEQARKGAEKIGQLQFEVQNINYILMKLGAQGEKTKVKGNRFTGVLLKDFIYSSRRKRQKRKKGCLCCAKPKTRED